LRRKGISAAAAASGIEATHARYTRRTGVRQKTFISEFMWANDSASVRAPH
jgi:hypothetical protein